MIVIADTSPLNYLIWIGEADVLPALYSRVVVPPMVRQELSREGAPGIVTAWISQAPAWLETVAPVGQPDLELAPDPLVET